MTTTAAFVAGATLLGVVGHRPLFWLADRRVDPTVLLTGWVLSTIGLVTSALTTAVLLVLPAEDHSVQSLLHLALAHREAGVAGRLGLWPRRGAAPFFKRFRAQKNTEKKI